ncbi:hypothetical protein, partial [Psittacicella gerlachiana]
MNNSFALEKKPNVNVVIFSLRFFFHNWQVLTGVFLITITVLYAFNHLFEALVPQLSLKLTTTNTDQLSALAIVDQLNILNVSWLIVKTFVEFFIMAVIALILKSIVSVIEDKNPDVEFKEIKDLSSGISLKTLIAGFLPVVFSAPMLKLALLAIWRSFQFLILLIFIAIILNILLFSLGGGVVSIIYIVFKMLGVLIPLIVTVLVVFKQYT